jgi:predicted dehydrogenase
MMFFASFFKASLIFFLTNNQEGPSPSSEQPLNIALLGAGIFATASHAPMLEQLSHKFNTVAVWSRTHENAVTLADRLGAIPVTDLDMILASPNVDAVICAMPLDIQPQFVLKALQAGKHVLSEKPVAATLQEATALIEEYEAAYAQTLVWNVAGQFRYNLAVKTAKQAIQEIGSPFLLNLKIRAPFLKSSSFSEAMWRNDPVWYGGMIVEAFVHASAMLRGIFGTPISVSAITKSVTPHIPCLDTMTAQISYPFDLHGTVSLTYASTEHEFELEIIGSEGRMVLTRKQESSGYILQVETSLGNKYSHDIPFGSFEDQLLDFSNSIHFYAERFHTPQEALADLELVQACLESGKQHGTKVFLQSSPLVSTSKNKTPRYDHLLELQSSSK